MTPAAPFEPIGINQQIVNTGLTLLRGGWIFKCFLSICDRRVACYALVSTSRRNSTGRSVPHWGHLRPSSNSTIAASSFARSEHFRREPFTVVRQPLGERLRKLRERKLIVQHDPLRRGSHARGAKFSMKGSLATLAGELNVFHAELLLRNHRRAKDRSAMTASRFGARPMLRPEGIDDLGSLVAIVLAFFRAECERIEVGRHLLVGDCSRRSLPIANQRPTWPRGHSVT